MNTEAVAEELAENWNFSRDFPVLDSHAIERPAFLDTIIEILGKEVLVVFLEGDAGDGASTTLGQFCKRYQQVSFSLFIKPGSSFAYSIDYLRLVLAEQFFWYLNAKALPNEYLTGPEYQQLLHSVRKKAKGRILYIVVDGLHQIPREDALHFEEIIKEVLPIGMDGFRFVIAGQQKQFAKLSQLVPCKPYQQLRFHQEETTSFLDDLKIEAADCAEIHRLCNGSPGKVASVKRLLSTGMSLVHILDAGPGGYPAFLSLEFAAVDRLSVEQRKLMAFLIFSRRSLTREEILEATKVEQDQLDELFLVAKFIFFNNKTNVLEFTSESHRKLSEKRLESFQKDVLTLQIQHLLKNPDSTVALRFLPTYYQQLGQDQEIVAMMTSQYFARLLQVSESITTLQSQAQLGVKSAQNLKKATDILRFTLQRSVFRAVSDTTALESEMAALVALGQTSRALELANQGATKEQRLRMLATYCRKIREDGQTVPEDVASVLRDLSDHIDFAAMGDQAIGIATDLVFVLPELATSIVEAATRRPDSNPSASDSAFLHLSYTSVISRIDRKLESSASFTERISDRALQGLSRAMETFVTELSLEQLKRIVEEMEVTSRLGFLCAYVQNPELENTLDVVDYALASIIADAKYTPTAADFAALARTLAREKHERSRVRGLITKIEMQARMISATALSKGMVELQMLLAHAESLDDIEKSDARILDAYFDVANIETLETKCECYAIMLRMLRRIDRTNRLENAHSIRQVIRQDLFEAVDFVLLHTADHLSVVRSIVRELSHESVDDALNLAGRLNTEFRRDATFVLIADTIIGLACTPERIAGIKTALAAISNRSLLDTEVRDLHRALQEGSLKTKRDWREALAPYVATVYDSGLRCEAMIAQLGIDIETGTDKLDSDFLSAFRNALDRVDSVVDRIDISFRFAEKAAKLDKAFAAVEFEVAYKSRCGVHLASSDSRSIIQVAVALTERLLSPILKVGQYKDEMLIRISRLIEGIPCPLTRIQMLSSLAERAACSERIDVSKKILIESILPTIKQLDNQSVNFQLAIQVSFPAYYVVHPAAALESLKSIVDRQEVDEAIYSCVLRIVRNLPVSEPYIDHEYASFSLQHQNALDILVLLERMSTDFLLYYSICALVDVVCGKQGRKSFTAQQKAEYQSRLTNHINQVLPDGKNIKHDGFKIAALSQASRLTDSRHSTWQTFLLDAQKIPNAADASFVLMIIAQCIPKKFDALRKATLQSALTLIDKIPSPIDQLSHYESYARIASTDSKMAAKEILRKAVSISVQLESTSRVKNQRRALIDLADKIDPALAAEIVKNIDDDPARAEAKRNFSESVKLANTKRQIANAKTAKEVADCDPSILPDAAWKNLSSLVANRLTTKGMDVMMGFLPVQADIGLIQAFPALSWFAENVARRYTSAKDVQAEVLPMFEVMLLTAEISADILAITANRASSSHFDIEATKEGLLVHPQDRAHAMEIIRNWLRENGDEYIKLSDPYFKLSDLDFLQLVLSECPNCSVQILTQKDELVKQKALDEEAFRTHWNTLVHQEPPATEIIGLSTDAPFKKGGPIHDRWLITKGAGLRLGTSYNSIGDDKLSEISEMTAERTKEVEAALDCFLNRQRTVDGVRVKYVSFTI